MAVFRGGWLHHLLNRMFQESYHCETSSPLNKNRVLARQSYVKVNDANQRKKCCQTLVTTLSSACTLLDKIYHNFSFHNFFKASIPSPSHKKPSIVAAPECSLRCVKDHSLKGRASATLNWCAKEIILETWIIFSHISPYKTKTTVSSRSSIIYEKSLA